MEYLPGIEQVIPIWNYKVYVYMDDNTVRLYDAAPLIQKGGIFKKLQDKSFFMERCTIMNDTLAWDLSGKLDPEDCIDICPDTIRECEIVEDVEALEKELFSVVA